VPESNGQAPTAGGEGGATRLPLLRTRRLERRAVTAEDVMAVAKDRGGMALDRFVPSRPHRMPA
jgi:hypothetical protein